MAEIEYKVIEGKNIETFCEQLTQDEGQGWRVVSMAVAPTDISTRLWKRNLLSKSPQRQSARVPTSVPAWSEIPSRTIQAGRPTAISLVDWVG